MSELNPEKINYEVAYEATQKQLNNFIELCQKLERDGENKADEITKLKEVIKLFPIKERDWLWATSKIQKLEAENKELKEKYNLRFALWKELRDEAIYYEKEIDELKEKSEKLAEALEEISENNVHTLDKEGNCLICGPYEDYICLQNRATQALKEYKGERSGL